jgi:hypothetical protein
VRAALLARALDLRRQLGLEIVRHHMNLPRNSISGGLTDGTHRTPTRLQRCVNFTNFCAKSETEKGGQRVREFVDPIWLHQPGPACIDLSQTMVTISRLV